MAAATRVPPRRVLCCSASRRLGDGLHERRLVVHTPADLVIPPMFASVVLDRDVVFIKVAGVSILILPMDALHALLLAPC